MASSSFLAHGDNEDEITDILKSIIIQIAFGFIKSSLVRRFQVALKIFWKNQNRVNRFLCVSVISFD